MAINSEPETVALAAPVPAAAPEVQTAAPTSGASNARRLWRRLPLLFLIIGGVAAVFGGAGEYLSLDTLKTHGATLRAVAGEPWTVVVFMLAYAAVVAFSIPGGTVMSVAGGFMFGQWLGTAVVVFAATFGATLLFLAARSGFAEALKSRAAPWLLRLEAGFIADAFNYLLILRLVPLFPFFVVNLVPAFLGVRLRTFVLATILGIIPGSAVFVAIGVGVESVIARGDDLTLAGALTPEVIAALCGLALLAGLPVVWKRWRGRRQGADAAAGG